MFISSTLFLVRFKLVKGTHNCVPCSTVTFEHISKQNSILPPDSSSTMFIEGLLIIAES